MVLIQIIQCRRWILQRLFKGFYIYTVMKIVVFSVIILDIHHANAISNSEPSTTHLLPFQSTSQHKLDSPASSVNLAAERPQFGYRIHTEAESSLPSLPAALLHAD